MMLTVLETDDLASARTDFLSVLCFEDTMAESPVLARLDAGLGGLLRQLAGEEEFQGKKGQSLLLHTHGRLGASRVQLLGGGARKDFQPADLRLFAAKAARGGNGAHARTVTLAVPELDAALHERAGQFLTEGALLGTYQFDRYLTGDRKKPLHVETVQLIGGPGSGAALRAGLKRGEAVARGVRRARDLVNEPAAEVTPSRMAEEARLIAAASGLELSILGPKECAELGMGMFLAVARGSEEEPRFIHLSYRPRDQAPRKKVVLIGKGVTFDSGGLSLKTTEGMLDMKIDMAGAATVIATMSVLPELGCPHEVHALAACTENMPSGRAYKLGDVLRSMAGKTVEINNTDAEGRLTLGDALCYAVQKIKPDEVFDFATLTGACVIALGPYTAGVMGNDAPLIERWLAAAKQGGEDMWHLPLPDRLKDMLKSEIADMKNTGQRYGGALTAGIFLREFVEGTPWVHVDLAGPAATDKEWGHQVKGATGFGVATLAEYLTT